MTKFKKFRRILAGVLCCAMAFSCMSVAAFAMDDMTEPNSGLVEDNHESATMNPVKDVTPIGGSAFYKIDNGIVIYADRDDGTGWTAVPSAYILGSAYNEGNIAYGMYVVNTNEVRFVALSDCRDMGDGNILREQYPIEGMAVCSRLPGRSRNSVMQRVFRLNLTVSSRWTKEEDDILRTHYPKEGVAVCSRIPGRTKEATMSRVSHLGIASRRRRWTKGEDDILRKYYPIEGTAVYSRLPGRTRHGIQKRVGSHPVSDGVGRHSLHHSAGALRKSGRVHGRHADARQAHRTGSNDAHADNGDGLRRRRGDPAAGHSGGAHIRKGGVQCE